MAQQSENNRSISRLRRGLNPMLDTLTPKHSEVFQRYQIVRIVVDFGAASCFVVGSVLFLFSNSALIAASFFLIGSIMFAFKPTIDLIRAFHLSKIPFRRKDDTVTVIERR